MDRTTQAGILLVVTLFASSIAIRFEAPFPGRWYLAGGAVLAVLAGWFALQRRVQTEDSTRSSSVWDAIPAWQYDGRHAESGGLARSEQEDAIKKVNEKATELEQTQQHTADAEEK